MSKYLPGEEPMPRTEQEIQKQILDELGKRPDVYVWRQNTGVAKAHGHRVRFGHVGSGDISGLVKGGRRLEIEVKTPTGIVSDAQLKFGQRVNELGGIWFVARSFDEAMRKLKEAMT